MAIILFLLPIFVSISGILLYPHNGKKEFLKLDLVQFFYAFIVAPLLYLWFKTFIYFLLKSELGAGVSQFQIFLIDSTFSLLFLYIFAFVVIHSLTATFNRRLVRDPLYDIFAHSEFFHLWVSHVVMYIGLFFILSFVSFLNIAFPLTLQISNMLFYCLCATGLLGGFLTFMVVWLTDLGPTGAKFTRLMKLLFGIFFMLFCVVYFTFTPSFNASRAMFWWSFSALTMLVMCSFFTYKFERAQSFFERISGRFKYLQ
ncbi:hypothetical protein KA082_03340 [Candidatus Woesebacteria bacterium]|nr:hypothetical protein [Candidatus Woesebacteria bacterium]